MITVTGRTFDHRDTLIAYGGRWNNADRRWEFDRLPSARLANLRATVGLIVGEAERPRPKPQPSLIERIAALLDDDAPISNRKPGLGRSKLYGDDPTYHDHFADKSPSAFFGFTSLGAFIDYVDGLSPNAAGSGWETDNEEFTGTANMSEALHLARHGWHDGVEAALDVVERLSLANPRVKRRKPSMAGGAVSVGRMLAGDPAHMIRRPRQPGRKVVTFFIEAGVAA